MPLRELDARELEPLLGAFPPVQAAFAYGSAVFPQRGYSSAQQADSMTDLVFCTDDQEAWHRENLRRHPAHYSSLSLGGPRAVVAVQERFGAGVYYNTLVHVHGRLIKYGVVRTSMLCDDLLRWHSLYLSGRMHKPVRMLVPPPADLAAAARINLHGALAAALLLLPARFDETALFSTICGLSYAGDVRMGVGESYGKVGHIVSGKLEPLRQLYVEPIAQLQQGVSTISLTAPGGGCSGSRAPMSAVLAAVTGPGASAVDYEQDISLAARRQLLDLVPPNARQHLLPELQLLRRGHGQRPIPPTGAVAPDEPLEEALEDAWRRAPGMAAASEAVGGALQRALFTIVRRASLAQTLKGVATAGALRSARYAFTKVRKRLLMG